MLAFLHTTGGHTMVVGRDQELAQVARLLDGVADGPAVLGLWGEAGIGKSTVWRGGLRAAEAQGFTVLACRAAATEVRLSYAGLADLLAEFDPTELRWLPPPQRRALDAALLRNNDSGPEPRAVAAAFLSVLNRLAAEAPVLVAVDDVHWLDEPTRRVVAFAVRRCAGSLAALTSGRDGAPAEQRDDIRPRDPSRLRHLMLGPLGPSAVHHVLMEKLGRSYPRPIVARLARVSGGNPFYAVEMARALDAGPSAFPASLRTVVRDRLASLPPEARESLLVVSALTVPRLETVRRACGDLDSLSAAETAGVVELAAGRVVFSHPLLAHGVYAEASPSSRRALHRRLSRLVTDSEERARHLALAAVGPEPEAVQALDAAADQARRRGAPSAAAELLEMAIDLGADDPSRRVRAARDHFDAEDPLRARAMLEDVIAELEPGGLRARALGLLGTVLYQVDHYERGTEVLRRALAEAREEPALRAEIAVELSIAFTNRGRLDEAVSHARIAVREAGQVRDEGLRAETLGALALTEFLSGRGVDEDVLADALATEDLDRRSHALRWPSLHAAMICLWTHRVGRARELLADLHERCLQHGIESDVWFLSFHEANAALWTGDVERARQLSMDTAERALMVGAEQLRGAALATQALVDGWMGQVADARAAGERAVAIFTEHGMAVGALFARGGLGALELSVGNAAEAARWLGPAATTMAQMGLHEPECVPFLPDAVEALVALGRLEEAEPLVERLEVAGRRPGRTWAEAVGARGRGLVAAARGDLDAARSAFDRALAAHDRLPLPYDRARTLLACGRLQRRRNERSAARTSLAAAAAEFDASGARRWAELARSELGERAVPREELTPAERRVAELAARGLTNREVAAALSISQKTVEANLSRSYRKLGIRTRAQLGGWLARRPSGAPGPGRPPA